MLGTPASCTLWMYMVEYNKPKATGKLPKSAPKETPTILTKVVGCTADPTGENNFSVARLLVLGETPYEGNNFRLLSADRMFDAMGFVQTESLDKIAGMAPEKPGNVLIAEEQETDEAEEPDDGSELN